MDYQNGPRLKLGRHILGVFIFLGGMTSGTYAAPPTPKAKPSASAPATSPSPPPKVATSPPTPSRLTAQIHKVEKLLKSKLTFEKKAKVLTSLKKWTDKEVFSHSEKWSDEDLAQVMQYSNLLKALEPQKLTPKNCKASAEKVLEEDLTPISEKPSAPAQTILGWLKLFCR